MMSKRIPLFTALILFAAALLSGCSIIDEILPITPERSAVLYVKEMKMANFSIYKESVEAIQMIEISHHELALVHYSGIRHGNGVETREFVLETEKDQTIRWETGSGMCHSIDDATDAQPITVGTTRSGSIPQDSGYTTVYGMVRDPQITRIVVTWEDELTQPVEVRENTYITAREGEFVLKKVEAFNDLNEVVYTTEGHG